MKSNSLHNFVPHPFLRGGQLQTLAGHLSAPPKTPLTPASLEVPLGDGDRLIIHADSPANERPEAPILLIFHGLSGSSMSIYAQHIATKLTLRGARVIRVNHRGCGASAETSRGIYHAGAWEDVDTVTKFVSERWPDASLKAVGFSLSGNMLLHWIGRPQSQQSLPAKLKGVMSVCPPVQLDMCSHALLRWSNIHFDQYFTRSLIQTAKQRNQWPAAMPQLRDRQRPWLTLRDFDDLFTARLAGFQNRDDYYSRSSAFQYLKTISLPTTVLAAKDDPFIPAISYSGAPWSTTTKFILTPSGGHVGFIAKSPTLFGDKRWLDAAVIEWFENSPW